MSNVTRPPGAGERAGAREKGDMRETWGDVTKEEQVNELRRLEELRTPDDGRTVPGGTFTVTASAGVIAFTSRPTTPDTTCNCTGTSHEKGKDPYCAFTPQERNSA